MRRLARHASSPVDGASLAAFRIGFGAILLASTLRFAASGWVERFWVQPRFFFRYWGFGWVPVPEEPALWAILAGQALFAALLMLGAWTRVAAAGFALLFAWTELIDVTTYLNHYYLVTLLALLLTALPTERRWSVDAWRARRAGRPLPTSAPRWALWLLRAQFAVVWTYAGVAKLEPDWWLHAWPLRSWLLARSEWPLLGPWFELRETAYLFAWGGLLYDLSIAGWLSWRRSRPLAFAVVVGFHVMVGLLFQIGIFPWLMVLGATLFFAPAWPLRPVAMARGVLAGRHPDVAPPRPAASRAAAPIARRALTLCALWLAVQVAVPLRTFAYPGSVVWAEEGMRWSWRVMLREKHGDVSFRVRQGDGGAEVEVPVGRYLDGRQQREMAGQPDLILQLAHHIRDDLEARGWREVQVRVDALVSLNGRPPAPLIDPQVDLAKVSDGLTAKTWILAAPSGRPADIGRRLLSVR